ncbi:MAG: hypothetical protein R3208_13670 [Ketobacteraceae bacterium]|nr:hypothetical protein [Ketobacteraceae bacterium]
MATAYVVRNQLGQYLTKKSEWCSGRDASIVFCKPHFDEALNQLFEINTRDIKLRGKVVEVDVEDKKPVITEYGPDPVQHELSAEEESSGAESRRVSMA